MRPIGLRLPTEEHGYTASDVVETATRADELGYHSVWMPENQGRDAFMCLARIAAVTADVRLGTGIVCVYARTPAMTAMSAATLDEMSDGRAILGLGASSRETVEEWHGTPFDRPLRHVRETIEIVRAAFRDDRVTYDGELYRLTDYPTMFEPVQDTVPIYNAALGATNRRLTGEFADGWLPVHVPVEELADRIAEIRGYAADAGRKPDDVTIAPYVLACVSEDGTTARRRVSELLAFYIGAMDYYAGVFTDLGYGEVVDDVQAAYANDGRTAAAERVSDTDLVDNVTIAGRPEEARSQLQAYYDQGVDVPIVYPPVAASEVVESTIEALAPRPD